MFNNMVFISIPPSRRPRDSKPMVSLFENGSVRLNAQAFELARSVCNDPNVITVMISECGSAIAITPCHKDGVKKPKFLGCQSASLCKIIGVIKKVTLELVIHKGMLCAEIQGGNEVVD